MTAIATPSRAALRDASWFRCPSTDKPVKYHVVVDDSGVAGCSVFTIKGKHLDESLDLAEVLPSMRCMRPGCRKYWPKTS